MFLYTFLLYILNMLILARRKNKDRKIKGHGRERRTTTASPRCLIQKHAPSAGRGGATAIGRAPTRARVELGRCWSVWTVSQSAFTICFFFFLFVPFLNCNIYPLRVFTTFPNGFFFPPPGTNPTTGE